MSRRLCRKTLGLALVWSLFTTTTTTTTPTHAADADRILRGSALAANHCGQCHAVGLSDLSPHKITPPLRALVERFPVDMLLEAQKTGIVGGHDEMPMFQIGPEGMAALLAYIDSLNPTGPYYLQDRK